MLHLNSYRAAPLIALATLSLSAPLAHSVTLGELQLQSYVGQHFYALVPYRLNAGESLSEQCVELLPTRSELPSMGAATIRLRPSSEQSGFVVVESRSAVGEPTVGFGLRIACGNQQFTRDFTAFLNIAPINNEREASTRLRSVREVEKAPRDFEFVPLKETEQFIIRKPMSLKELTKRYYPVNTPQYPKYLQKLSNTNPDLDPNAQLDVGTTVIIPDRLRSKRKSAPVVVNDGGQLRLDTGAPMVQSTAAPISSAQYAKDLEQKVKMLEELQLKMQLEVEQLNGQLRQMNELNASSVLPLPLMPEMAAELASQAAIATMMPIAAIDPLPASQPEKAPADESNKGWLIGLGVLLLAVLAAIFLWRRSRSEDGYDMDGSDDNPTLMGQLNPFTKRKPSDNSTMMSIMHHPGSGIEVSDYAGNDLARIQIMLAQGDVAESIDLLYKSIDEDSEDIERWLMLFRVFRQQGMKSEYAALAQNLQAIVKDEADWELVRNIGAKLDPENPLYRRTENPLADVVKIAAAQAAATVDFDIYPVSTPSSMMHAFLDTESETAPQIPGSPMEPITDLLLDLQLPDTTGNRIQDRQPLQAPSELEILPIFEVDFLLPSDEITDEIELNVPHDPDLDKEKPSI